MSKAVKYLVRNTNGSILAKYDKMEDAEKFYNNHAAARYLERVTVNNEIIFHKKSSSISKIADLLDVEKLI